MCHGPLDHGRQLARHCALFLDRRGRSHDRTPGRRLFQNATATLGLATAYGLDEHVLNAYRFLIQHYVEGDHIYFFSASVGLAHSPYFGWADTHGRVAAS